MLLNILLQAQHILPTDSIHTTHKFTKEALISAVESISSGELLQELASKGLSLCTRIVVALIVFYIGRFIVSRIYNVVRLMMTRRKVDKSLTSFILSLLKIVMLFILAVTIVSILGIETSSFIAIFASAGVAIGMALSGTLQNFAGGVLILVLKPYEVGDYIEFGSYSGIVTEIQIFNTIICTADNRSIIIPNGGLSTGTINNFSREDFRRIQWDIDLAYGDDFDLAKETALEIIKADSRIVYEYLPRSSANHKNVPCPPQVFLGNLADNSIKIVIRAWVKSEDYWGAFFDINEKIYKIFPTKGLNFPFPQLDVHIDKI